MLTDLEIADVLQRVAERLVPDKSDHNWVVFIEVVDMNGAPSYTYRMGEGYCDTADQAIRQAVSHLPKFLDPMETRIRGAFAARQSHVTEYDIVRFEQTPQFQVR